MAHLDVGVPNELLLRVSPPRVPRNCILRSQLNAEHPHFDAAAMLVQAPAGFGKTFLLAQWRRDFLARGAVVPWVSVQPQDDGGRFLQCLAMAVRLAAARPTFGHTLLSAGAQSGLDGITAWLAEVAQSALRIVLMIDDVDRLADEAREMLTYLLRNAPPNLRVVLGARSDCELGIEDLLAYGDCVLVGPTALRFQLVETLALIQERCQGRLDPDSAARLHDLTEGWPLGLQLALSVIARSGDPRADVAAMAAGASALHDDLMNRMLANLDPADVGFLTQVSILDHLRPDLCRAVTGDPDTESRLARMCRDTPVLVAAEQGDWLRLHILAREALRQRAAALPGAQQAALHERACAWLADHDELELAAWHALRAGRQDLAYDLAERSVYESLMTRGHQTQVLEWVERMPAQELERRPRMLLAAAWSLALSERNDEAERWVERLLAGPQVSDALRCECALILGGAALYADDPDRFARLHDPWADDPPLRDPLLLRVHANRTAYRTLIAGNPPLARMRQHQAPRGDAAGALTLNYLDHWGGLVIGLTYLWEGQVKLAEELLRPMLAHAENDLGRRAPFSCMLAALLAAAVWEQNRVAEVAPLLANRLDVLERRSLPEAVLLAYRILARAAVAQGQEHRAIEWLDAMHALGVARHWPRLCIGSLTDQIRLHARRYRAESCRALLAQIEVLIEAERPRRGPLWLQNVEALQDLARGYTCVAARQWREALAPLARANAYARAFRMGRLNIEILGLRAFVLDQCGERAQELLREAADLAQAYGLLRVFADVHPDLGGWIQRLSAAPVPAPLPAAADPPRSVAPPKVQARMALTPKEAEVLELLARNLTNKEIGLAMQVGEETIKWHMKNLFAKLDAGNRKQLVARARLFGLIE